MKRSLIVTAIALLPLVVFTVPAFAQKKTCEDLKTEIAAKLDEKGVKNYTLTIVDMKDVKENDKVVGSCDGGTKRITYTRE